MKCKLNKLELFIVSIWVSLAAAMVIVDI